MSLQDDYYDLAASLNDWQKKALDRIWEAFVSMENEQEDLLKLRACVKTLVELGKTK